MAAHAVPALYAVVIWWFSTGLIILLDHRPRATHPWSMAGGTLVLAGCVARGRWSRSRISPVENHQTRTA